MPKDDGIDIIAVEKRDLNAGDEGGKAVNRRLREENERHNEAIIEDINDAKVEAVICNIDNIDNYYSGKKIKKWAVVGAVASLGLTILAQNASLEVANPVLSQIFGATSILSAVTYFLSSAGAIDGRNMSKRAEERIKNSKKSRELGKKYTDIGQRMSDRDIFDVVVSTAKNMEEYIDAKLKMDEIEQSMDDSVM